jgi:hypothetical protein
MRRLAFRRFHNAALAGPRLRRLAAAEQSIVRRLIAYRLAFAQRRRNFRKAGLGGGRFEGWGCMLDRAASLP